MGAKLVCLLLSSSLSEPNPITARPRRKRGAKGKREREENSQGRTEGRKEGRGDSAGCVSLDGAFSLLLPRNRPLFPPCSLSVPKLRPPLPSPPFFCHKPFLPSFLPFFLLPSRLQHPRPPTPSPKKGGAKEKEAEECRGNFWGWLLPPTPFLEEGGAKMGGGSGFDPRRATLQRRRRENTRKGGKGGGGRRGEQGSKLFCAPASPSLLFLSR